LINTAGVIVRLRNLTIHGGGGSSTGIRFTAGASLFVEKCLITNFTDTNARGISFAPTSGASTPFVSDTTITNNNEPSTGLGIAIEVVPSGTASVRAAFDRLRAENNRQGILVSAASGQITQVQLHDSFVANNLTNGLNVLGAAGQAIVPRLDQLQRVQRSYRQWRNRADLHRQLYLYRQRHRHNDERRRHHLLVSEQSSNQLQRQPATYQIPLN
jgi:hypothetical protein